MNDWNCCTICHSFVLVCVCVCVCNIILPNFLRFQIGAFQSCTIQLILKFCEVHCMDHGVALFEESILFALLEM